MTQNTKAHPAEELLERYAMNRLTGPELDRFEDHLLSCAHCQDRLDEATEYVGTMRVAAEKVAADAPPESAWRRWLRFEWLPMPTPAMAGALLLLVAVFAWHPWRGAVPTEWRTVELATMRGETAQTKGVEGYSLRLRLDVSGLDMNGAAAQIVSASGDPVAELAAPIVDGKAELTYVPGLESGHYWVRLKKSGETLREYSLSSAKP